MNPAAALAEVLVDELIRNHVTEAVLAPGSRNSPLSYALHAADAAGALRLHVRVDERSAAFVALGLAKRSGRPTPVVCTSGTAAVNLHPAVVEADASAAPLVALTADRPPERRGSGANQTIDQLKLFGAAVRWFHELGAPEERTGQVAYWRSAVCRAAGAATGVLCGRPGPVHLNVAFREPLVPDESDTWLEPLDGRGGGRAWVELLEAPDAAPVDDLPARTVVFVGDASSATTAAAQRWAEARGWPVLSEPSGNARGGPNAMGAAAVLLRAPEVFDHLGVERLVVVGRPTLERGLQALARRLRTDVVADRGAWADEALAAERVLPRPPQPAASPPDPAWLERWRRLDSAAHAALDGELDALAAQGLLTEVEVARSLSRAAPDAALVVLGPSTPPRSWFLAAEPRTGLTVLANRGAAGMDGLCSSAVGAALAHQRAGGGGAYGLLGDLTLLHDSNGLAIGPAEPRPDLTVVAVNNRGGAIFELLEQGGSPRREAFERVFRTDAGFDLGALARAHGVPHERVASPGELAAALRRPPQGLSVLEAVVPPGGYRELFDRLHAAGAAALRSAL